MNDLDATDRSHERAFSVALLRLNELIEADRDEEAEGDAVRDEMDMHWYRMDDRQRERMDFLSVDLEHLTQAKGKPDHVGPVDREWANELQSARGIAGIEGTDRILALLRDRRAGRPSGNIAFIQAGQYERLGMPEAALVFYEAAESRDQAVKTVTLIFVWRQGWMHFALPRAEKILAGHAPDPVAMFYACAVLMESVRNSDAASARDTLECVRNHLSAFVKVAEQAPPRNIDLFEVHPTAVMMLGMCHERIGDRHAAIKVYDRYLSKPDRDPSSDADIYGLRGSAKVAGDPQGAVKDFRAAIDRGTSSPLPFLFLVQHAFQSDKPLEAVALCNRVLNFMPEVPDVLKALFLEGLAIGMARLGQPKQWILETFDRAIDLSPNDERLQSNRAIIAAGSNRDEWKPVDPDYSPVMRPARRGGGSHKEVAARIAIHAKKSIESAGLRSVA